MIAMCLLTLLALKDKANYMAVCFIGFFGVMEIIGEIAVLFTYFGVK